MVDASNLTYLSSRRSSFGAVMCSTAAHSSLSTATARPNSFVYIRALTNLLRLHRAHPTNTWAEMWAEFFGTESAPGSGFAKTFWESPGPPMQIVVLYMFAQDYGTLVEDNIEPFWGLEEEDIVSAFGRVTVKSIKRAAVIAAHLVAAAWLNEDSSETSDGETDNNSADYSSDEEDDDGDNENDDSDESFYSAFDYETYWEERDNETMIPSLRVMSLNRTQPTLPAGLAPRIYVDTTSISTVFRRYPSDLDVLPTVTKRL